MMGFVHDDCPEFVRRKLRQTLGPHQGLHTADRNAEKAALRGLLPFLTGAAQTGCRSNLVLGLRQELVPVCQDKDFLAGAHAVLGHVRKYDGLARARRKHQQCLAMAAPPFPFDRCHGLLLIRSKVHQNEPALNEGTAGADAGPS